MINDFLLIEFGKQVKKHRQKLKLSQQKLSFKTGFHRTYIGMIERGERNISLTNMAVFAKTFDMPLHEFMKFEGADNHLNKYETKACE